MVTARLLLAGILIAVPTAATAQEPDGKAIYASKCRLCHGVRGTPSNAMLKKMKDIPTLDSAFMASRSEDSVVQVVTHGSNEMKPFREKLSEAEIRAVARYVRELALSRPPDPP